MTTPKPQSPRPVDPRTLPALATLVPHRRWVGWRWAYDPEKDKWTKPPYQASGANAKNNDPATWTSFETIWDLNGQFDGIGYNLLGLPSADLAAIDLDDVIDDGAILPWGEEVARYSYCERTPGGQGLRVLGTAPGIATIHRNIVHPGGGHFELYANTARYITVSGQALDPEVPLLDITDVIRELEALGKGSPKVEPDDGPAVAIDLTSLPPVVAEMIDKGTANGTRIEKRGPGFMSVVRCLKQQGHGLASVLALLEKHPNGVQGKYISQGRLAKELERVWGKILLRGDCRYHIADGVLCEQRRDQYGLPYDVQLANFAARLAEDQLVDDGASRTRRYRIDATLIGGMPLPDAVIEASALAGTKWISEHWGAPAIVYPTGAGTLQRLEAAIKTVSGHVPTRQIFAHLGWRRVEGRWFYLHAGGAIGRDGPVGGITVELDGELAGFVLHHTGDLRPAVQAALEMLDLNATLAAAVWRAPLIEFCPVSFSAFLAGRTGSYKSATTGVAQAHWGGRWDGVRFAANWLGTANSLEKLAFLAKDCVLVIDDFAPGGAPRDIAGLHRKAGDLLRSAGNLAGRSRMRADTSLRPTYWPRGLLVSSGEEVPGGHSLRARLAIEQLQPDGINVAILSRMQAAASDGLLARAMAGYVEWIAQIEDPAAWAARRRQELTAKITKPAHNRIPDVTAGLMIGVDLFLQYARHVGALGDVDNRMNTAWRVLLAGAEAQGQELREEDPVEVFLAAVPAVLAGGRAHLASTYGALPTSGAAAIGWEQRQFGDNTAWVPLGKRIGWWHSSYETWLLPDAAIGEVNALLREQGRGIPIGRHTLGRRLREAGKLVAHEQGTFTKVAKVAGSTQRVFALKLEALAEVTDPFGSRF